jgi:antitoxin component YwqK of YwqJK toxin-antitoxin module
MVWKMNRVNIREIDFNDDYSYSYRGVLFTGIACEYDDDGKLVSELKMENGIQEGLSSEFFPAGPKRSERCYHNNTLHGESREWFENGNLKERTFHEFGVLIERETWDSDGNAVSGFRLTENDQAYQTLERLRKAKWSLR